jgi:DNA gyrase inhibitor GyrI
MPDLEVRIVTLDPMRVAWVRVVSDSPESQAWEKLQAWAEPRALLADVDEHPVFGFDNPPPQPDQEEYGYEFWIRVSPDVEASGDVEIKEFPGGLYAVTTCRLHGEPNVAETWRLLWEWVQSSEYQWRQTHELEQPHDPLADEEDLILDLYLPIEE